MTSSASSASTNALDLIHSYYSSKPNFNDRIGQEQPPNLPTDQLERLGLDDKQKNNKFLKSYFSGEQKAKRSKMPVHPTEENATGNITDQVAKESKDSNASSHELHDKDTGAKSGGSLSAAAAHKSAPGPVIAENIGEPASKEELKKRTEELNK